MTNNLITVKDEATGVEWQLDIYNATRTMRDPSSGKLITMDLGVTDVHIDSALSNYAAGYKQWDPVADEVCPVIPSSKASDKYYTWDKDDVFQDAQSLVVAPGGAVSEISPRLSNTNYACVPYGIASHVPTELAANADAPLQVEQQAVGRCLNAIGLGRERRVSTLLGSSGNWTGGYTTTLGATAKWNAGSASNPIQDLYTAIESSLTPVKAIVMSERTMHDFAQNAAVQKYIASKTNVKPIPGSADMSALLELPPFIISRMKGKVTSSTYGYVFGDNVALIYNNPSTPKDGQSISTAYTFRWTGADARVPDGTMQGGFLVRSYFDPKRGGRGGRTVVVVHNDIEVMTSVYAGGLIINAHQ